MLTASQFRKCIPNASEYLIKKDREGKIVERIAKFPYEETVRLTACGYLLFEGFKTSDIWVYTCCYASDMNDIKRNFINKQ